MKQLTNYEKVRAFHKSFGLDLDKPFENNLFMLRERLIDEEVDELDNELYLGKRDTQIHPNLIKEMADVLYVIYGMAATFGIDIDTAFNRVHESNMSKLGDDGKPIYREDGKALKGPNYKPPTMEDLVPKGEADEN